MSRKQSIQSKYFKFVGVAALATVGVIGLIRCVPSDQAVVSDDTVSEKVKEAEAAEEAESLAMKEAHGDEGKGHGEAGHGETSKTKSKQASTKHGAEAKEPKKAEKAVAHAEAKHEAKHETKKEVAHAAPKHETKHEADHGAAHGAGHSAGHSASHEVAAHTKAEPARQPASVGVPAHAATGSLYIVQVGAFKVKENAEKLTSKLKEAGYPVRLQTITHSKNGELHLVRFEPTPNKSEAQAALDKFETKESMKASLLTVAAGS
jgi:cell division septation protein DedD